MFGVFLTGVAALAVLGGAIEPSASAATSPAAATEGQQEFRAARVEIVGFAEVAVLAALRLRLPRLPIERHGGPTPEQSPYVYLAIERTTTDTGRLRAITSDGHAYERSFSIEIGQEVRVAASTAASLLFAIEEGVVAPDRKDVAIPEPISGPPIVEPVTEPPIVEPTTEPIAKPPSVAPMVEPAPAPTRPWELAATLHGAALLGLGPPSFAGAFAAAGGGLGLELRSPRGAAAALELRGLGRSDGGLGLGRLRIGLAGGYTLRRGRFELPMLLGLAIEPWWTTRSGGSAAVFSGQAEVSRRPLLAGYLRLSPALRIAVKRGPLVGLRIGPRFELGGAFVVDDGAQVVGLKDIGGTERFRLGGLELSLGLELGFQFGLP